MNEPRILILETSERVARIALAGGERVLEEHRLEETRRHARDLVPQTRAMLQHQGWKIRDLQAVFVSRGPGSYTGLRVGIMSAKTLAFATGCVLLAIDTFSAIARQAPADVGQVDVIADAQKDNIYVRRFVRTDTQNLVPQGALTIRPLADWLPTLTADIGITGPGLNAYRSRIPIGIRVLDPSLWQPQVSSILHLGLERYRTGQRDDWRTVEPLYLRPSSAEEMWTKKRGSNEGRG